LHRAGVAQKFSKILCLTESLFLRHLNTTYLIYFNTVRPHLDLNKLTPMAYLVFKGVLSNMFVTKTRC